MSDLLSSAAAPWAGLAIAIVVLLAIDLFIVRGRGGEMSLRLATVASLAWVGVSLAFFGILLLLGDSEDAGAYLAGYLVEKSLSLDNVFVFLLVFTAFGVPVAERHRLLTYGIVGALVLRLIFIVVGAAVLGMFSWLNFVFAGFLIWTGWRMYRHRHDHDGEQELVEKLSRRLPMSSAPPEGRLARRENGRRVLTTAGAALVAIAIVDIIFAVDSVPAILAITTDSYIVFAANAFALLGLRALFALLEGAQDRFVYLPLGLASILIFIGIKMLIEDLFHIPVAASLGVIVLALALSIVLSLRKPPPSGPTPPAHVDGTPPVDRDPEPTGAVSRT